MGDPGTHCFETVRPFMLPTLLDFMQVLNLIFSEWYGYDVGNITDERNSPVVNLDCRLHGSTGLMFIFVVLL